MKTQQGLDFTGVPTLAQVFAGGVALHNKVRSQVEVSGAYQASRNLRKQGYPIDVALALVAGRV